MSECIETCPYKETIQSLIRASEENQKDHERIRRENTETVYLVKDVQADVKLIKVDINSIFKNQEKMSMEQDKFTETIKESVAEINKELSNKINGMMLAPIKRREKILIGVTIGCFVSCFTAIITLVISLLK